MGPLSKLTGNKTAAGVRAQVEWLLSLEMSIKDIFDLAKVSDDMDREAFNQSTYNSIMILLPQEYHLEMVKEDNDGSAKEMMTALYSYIVDMRGNLQKIIKTLEFSTGPVKDDVKFTGTKKSINIT